MHFRGRGQIIQLIRTKYDSNSKKGKSEIIGRLAKGNPQITEALESALTKEERKDLEIWIAGHASNQKLKREIAARELAEQMALAEEWFTEAKGDDARVLAADLVPAWTHLRMALKRSGLVE